MEAKGRIADLRRPSPTSAPRIGTARLHLVVLVALLTTLFARQLGLVPLNNEGNQHYLFPTEEAYTSKRVCQATCITGDLRSVDQDKIDSWANLDMTNGDCHHLIVVGNYKNLGFPAYLHEGYASYRLKDQKMHSSNTLRTVYKSTLLPELKKWSSSKSSFTFIESSANQRDKYIQCMALHADRSMHLNISFTIYARARPDSLWYAHVSNYVKLDAGSLVASHADTAWIGDSNNLYFTQKGIEEVNNWYPGFIIAELMSARTFRPSTNVSFGFLPWVLCRERDSFATVFNFINHWITDTDTVKTSDYGVFCYRLYMVIGDDIFDDADVEDDHFPFAAQAAVMKYFNESANEAKLGETFSSQKPCSKATGNILEGSPVIKHDIEICNHWSSHCGDCLRKRFETLYIELLKYGSSAGTRLTYEDELSCKVYNGAVCDMIRSLRALAILATPSARRSFGLNGTNDDQHIRPCNFTTWLVSTIRGAPDAVDFLYESQLNTCPSTPLLPARPHARKDRGERMLRRAPTVPSAHPSHSLRAR